MIKLMFNLMEGSTSINRKWDIKATQFSCGDPNGAPPGCLQYFTTTSGTIMSYNFNDASSIHLPNQLYSNCIRREQGFCCIQYSVCEGVANSFTLDSLPTAAAKQGSDCTKDFILIPSASSTCTSNGSLQSRFCGSVLNIQDARAMNIPICCEYATVKSRHDPLNSSDFDISLYCSSYPTHLH